MFSLRTWYVPTHNLIQVEPGWFEERGFRIARVTRGYHRDHQHELPGSLFVSAKRDYLGTQIRAHHLLWPGEEQISSKFRRLRRVKMHMEYLNYLGSHFRSTSQPSTLPTRLTRRAARPSSSTSTTKPGRRTGRRQRPRPIPGLPSLWRGRCFQAMTRRKRTPRERRALPAAESILPWRWDRDEFIIIFFISASIRGWSERFLKQSWKQKLGSSIRLRRKLQIGKPRMMTRTLLYRWRRWPRWIWPSRTTREKILRISTATTFQTRAHLRAAPQIPRMTQTLRLLRHRT